jgi:hypothetical protein
MGSVSVYGLVKREGILKTGCDIASAVSAACMDDSALFRRRLSTPFGIRFLSSLRDASVLRRDLA